PPPPRGRSGSCLAAPRGSRLRLRLRPLPPASTSLPSATSADAGPTSSGPVPLDGASWPTKFPAREHCSRCGLCETRHVVRVSDACAFLGDGMRRNVDGLEGKVHGRQRELGGMVWEGEGGGVEAAEEARFGVLSRPMELARGKGVDGAQWTGVVTGIAVSMLEVGMVDAVVCIASGSDETDGDNGWSQPEPILARTVEDVLRGRGVKPALAPSLRVLSELDESPEIRRLLFCGVGCAVQAFRAIQGDLNLDEVYVLGTNCADNSPTPEDAREFLRQGIPAATGSDDGAILGYEFAQDFRVHVKKGGGGRASDPSYVRTPYFCLPGEVAEFAIADSCLACFDYTNALADVVVGYMGAPLDPSGQMDKSYQTLTVRNARGEAMVRTALEAGRLEVGLEATGKGGHEKFAMATVASDNLVQKMVGGDTKKEGMPRILGEIMASVMTAVGPKGVSFARYSVDYHVLRNYLHVLDVWGEDAAVKMVPEYCAKIVDKYTETSGQFRELVTSIKMKGRRQSG
ncbi:hypothetical protein ACHAWF_006575, partial [Thalassiosira exigua]